MRRNGPQTVRVYSDYGCQAYKVYMYTKGIQNINVYIIYMCIYFKFDSRAPSTFAIFFSIYCSLGELHPLSSSQTMAFRSGPSRSRSCHCPLRRFRLTLRVVGELWKNQGQWTRAFEGGLARPESMQIVENTKANPTPCWGINWLIKFTTAKISTDATETLKMAIWSLCVRKPREQMTLQDIGPEDCVLHCHRPQKPHKH